MTTPFLRLPPLVLEPEDFEVIWLCRVKGVRRVHCKPYTPHTGLGCAWAHVYVMPEPQYLAWTEDREKARRRHQP